VIGSFVEWWQGKNKKKIRRKFLKNYPVYLSRLLKEMCACRKRTTTFSSFYSFFMEQTSLVLYGIRVCGLSDVTDKLLFGLKLQCCSVLQETSGRANALQTTGGRAPSMLQHFCTGMCNQPAFVGKGIST